MLDKHVVIRTAEGKTVSKSNSLAVLRRYCSNNIVREVHIDRRSNGSGGLYIEFEYGIYCHTDFASYNVLRQSLRHWRNLRGVALIVNGEEAGVIEYNNESLKLDFEEAVGIVARAFGE